MINYVIKYFLSFNLLEWEYRRGKKVIVKDGRYELVLLVFSGLLMEEWEGELVYNSLIFFLMDVLWSRKGILLVFSGLRMEEWLYKIREWGLRRVWLIYFFFKLSIWVCFESLEILFI